MPIRMVDDENEQGGYNEQNDNRDFDVNPGGGGGGGIGGGMLLQFLPLLFGLFRSKKGLLVLALLAGGYFLVTKMGVCNKPVANFGTRNKGADLKEEEFAKANVYSELAADQHGAILPERVSLKKFAPEVQNQGKQGSCVAWSAAYYGRSIMEAIRQGKSGNEFSFSPAYLYNQIKLGNDCQGSYILRAMESMTKNGAVPMSSFPYDENNCNRNIPNNLLQDGSQYRINGFARLTEDANPKRLSVKAVKEHLAKDAPVVIGMMVGESFMQGMMGKRRFKPANGDERMMGFGGHAMCVIGYDDREFGGIGGFEIQNSWGSEWGENGVGWVSYPDFKYFVREAYGMEPLTKMGAAANVALNVQVGLYSPETKNYIALQSKGSNVFSSVNKVADGTKFKIEFKNNDACYTYLLGFENDGRANVLFPTPDSSNKSRSRFSPYCGVSGYRVFPKGANLVPMEGGVKDVFAIIVSKRPIDAFALRDAVNRNRTGDFTSRINAAATALGGISTAATYSNSTAASGAMQMASPAGDLGIISSIIEINK
jgi:hypothetical protein